MRRFFVTTGLASLALVAAFAQPAAGRHGPGPSTPNVRVTAQDPGTSSGLRIALDARADEHAVPSASLELGIAGMSVTDFTVHRVAAGDTGCPDDPKQTTPPGGAGIAAAVRGLAVLSEGNGLLPDGSAVQVWLDLGDNGTAADADQARVRLRPAPHQGEESGEEAEEGSCGGAAAWTYDSGWLTIRQVTAEVVPVAPPALFAENGIFLCYSSYQSEPGVWPASEAESLIADGYWLPYAVAGTVAGGTNVGNHHLVCGVASAQSVSDSFVGGDGDVLGPAYGGTFGIYPVVGS